MTSHNFWNRFGLQWGDRDICVKAVRDHYGGCEVEEYEDQGYCSCTLLVTPARSDSTTKITIHEAFAELDCTDELALIVQLRPALHAIDLNIVHAASRTYSTLVPSIKHLDLALPRGICAYEMKKLKGTPLSQLQRHTHSLDASRVTQLERLVTSFAVLVAQSWQSPQKLQSVLRTIGADSPVDESSLMLSQCHGKVGSTIFLRLERLACELPDAHLRKSAREKLRALQRMENYPVVLNHGDLIPSNILIDQNTWEITGMVDWAEAEYLPFGTCLYGLEHLLGYPTLDSSELAPTWIYLEDATRLRELFWTCLIDALPELEARVEYVRVIRDVGILLWHGIAWDDGAIDRVVNEVDDVEELVKLRAFLGAG